MVSMWLLIPAFVAGLSIGILTMALAAMAARNEQESELEAAMLAQAREVSVVEQQRVGSIVFTLERGEGFRVLEDHAGSVIVGPWLDQGNARCIFLNKVYTARFLASVCYQEGAPTEEQKPCP